MHLPALLLGRQARRDDAAGSCLQGAATPHGASKAVLDRFSETLYLEEKEKGRAIRVFSIAPGVIDTEMQNAIRASQAEDFSSLETFKGLKLNNELQSALETAVNLIDFLNRYNNDFAVGSLKILKQEL
mgnify:CR=1 FL=1